MNNARNVYDSRCERLSTACDDFYAAFDLLNESDMDNEALLEQVGKILDRISVEFEASAVWLRRYARHRMI